MDKIQSLRGMNDISEAQAEKFLYFLQKCSKIAQKYGHKYISTPILEQTVLFERSVGNSSDIATKEMYRFTDKGHNDVSLRPEGTASIVRHFIEKKIDKAGGVFRFFYYGPMFRYERPQKGRLRQFHQFGCETFGEDSYMEDLNIIDMVVNIFKFFEIPTTLHINSLGCDDCMPSYKKNLLNNISGIKLCDICEKRKITNPIRVFDCKNEKCQEKLQNIDKITDSLCKICQNEFDSLMGSLDSLCIKYIVNKNLVRGLDYYTKTAFEFISGDIGSQNAIAGGGRYNHLVEQLGGEKVSAVGFAIGIERLLELINKPKQDQDIWYIGATNDEALEQLSKIVSKKRSDYIVLTDYKIRSFTKHFNNAIKKSATNIAILNKQELTNGQIWTKDLTNDIEKIVSLSNF